MRNALEQVVEVVNPLSRTTYEEYDAAGNRVKMTDPMGRTTTYTYDPANRLTKISYSEEGAHAVEYEYDKDGNRLKMIDGSGTTTYTLDNDGQVKKVVSKGLPGEETTEYTYDENNRLTKAGSTAYEYDAANNPTKLGSSTYTYDSADELEKGTGLTYSFNEDGERIKTTPSGAANTYGYNQAGDLTSVERPEEGKTAAIKDTYAYNGDGLRVSETISGTTNYLAWDLAEGLPSILSNGTYSYIYGPGGLPVEQISSGGTVTYLHHDQAGSTRLLTGSTGTVTGKCTYSAYGAPTCEGTTTTPLGYDGQYTSSDTGLIYLRNRVYDPATAQFFSVDPLVEGTNTLARATVGQYVAAAMRSASGSGPYVYANDNPLNNYDPTGLFTLGLCVHGEVNFIFHIGASGCAQASTSGEVGGTVSGSVGIGVGVGVGATVGPQVSNASHISELSGPFANTGGQLGVGPDISLEAFGAPGACGPVVGGGFSAGVGLGVARWIGGSYTGTWSVNF